MGMTTSYVYDEEQLTRFANQVKDRVSIASGVNLDDYVVVIGKPSKFGYFISKLFGKEEHDVIHILVMKHTETKHRT